MQAWEEKNQGRRCERTPLGNRAVIPVALSPEKLLDFIWVVVQTSEVAC